MKITNKPREKRTFEYNSLDLNKTKIPQIQPRINQMTTAMPLIQPNKESVF